VQRFFLRRDGTYWQLELNHGDLYTLLTALDNVQEQLDALA
jgi:hypothetical protein